MKLFGPDGALPTQAPISWSDSATAGRDVLVDASTFDPHAWGDFDGIDRIGITAETFADGRLSSVGKTLRRAGFRGTLRAIGPLVPDQWRLLWSLGFDEVEVPEALADRQPTAVSQAGAPGLAPAPYAARLGLS